MQVQRGGGAREHEIQIAMDEVAVGGTDRIVHQSGVGGFTQQSHLGDCQRRGGGVVSARRQMLRDDGVGHRCHAEVAVGAPQRIGDTGDESIIGGEVLEQLLDCLEVRGRQTTVDAS